MIEVKYQGRHGNMIFQYLLARYISFLTNQTIDAESNYYRYTANRFIKFKQNTASVDKKYEDTIEITDKNVLNIIDKCKQQLDKMNSNFKLNGYFQDSTIYNEHRDFLKSIIIFNNNLPEKKEITKKSVLIHVRLDDFHRNGYDSEIISFNYYDNIIRSNRYTDIYLLYDKSTVDRSKYKDRLIRDKKRDYYDYDRKFLEYFEKKYSAKLVYSRNVGEDFLFFQYFDNIILSGSSFSFWGVVNIERKVNIHMPVHEQINALKYTFPLVEWMGHNVKVYRNIRFINYNEDQIYIDQYYPSCEGFVTNTFDRNKNIKRLYLAHHGPVAGFFSNCSMGLYNVVKYYNHTNEMPDIIDMSLLFSMYKKGAQSLGINNQSLCKILCFDECICKSCHPDLKNTAGNWTGRYTHNCYRTRNYDVNIGPHYFKEYMKPKPNSIKFKKSNFSHWIQFYPYTQELIDTTKDFFKLAFSPSDNILRIVKEIENKYSIDYEKTCVLFLRRGDKGRETAVPEYEDYVKKIKYDLEFGDLSKVQDLRFLIQSDETEFYPEMKKILPNCFELSDYIRTVPAHKKGQPDLGGSGNFEFSQKFLSIMNIMAKSKFIYTNTGNCSLWTYLHRTLYKEDFKTGFNQWIGQGNHWKNPSVWL